MQKRYYWFAVCVIALLALAATGCSREATTPTAAVADSTLFADAAAAADPALSADAGQASLPGLTMEPASTYSGSVSPTRPACSYDATTGRFICTPVVRDGLTYTRSYAFYDGAGKPQSARNADTRAMNTQVSVKGTRKLVRKNVTIGSVDVDRASDLTVSGLGKGAATHTLNGSEAGTSIATWTGEKGTVTSKETFEAKTTNVVVPAEGKSRWPLSGTTSRTWTTTVSRAGGPSRTSTTTETVTYNGTNVVDVTYVRDGKTRSCTKDLATGKLTCH